MKNKVTTFIVVIATLLLAGVAVFTAVRLFQLRQKPVAPNVPESLPKAAATASPVQIACQLRFAIATPTPSPSPTPTKSPSPSPSPRPTATPTKSPSPSPSPSPNPLCNSSCTSSSQCPSGLTCSAGFCRNPLCTTKSNCLCPTASPSPTPTKSPSPSPSPTATPTKSPSPSPSPSPVPQCNTSCTSSSQCPSGLSCYIASGSSGFCRNVSCTGESDCLCATPAPTPTSTATASPVPQCNTSCTTTAQCPSNLTCSNGQCRNVSCTGESDCLCATPAPTKTPTNPPIAYGATSTPVPQPTLPESGTDWPTILGAGFGVLVIIGSLLLAF